MDPFTRECHEQTASLWLSTRTTRTPIEASRESNNRDGLARRLYRGTSYQAHFSQEVFAAMSASSAGSDLAERMQPMQDQLQVIRPLLRDDLIHIPVWTVKATRLS
jgi:hypothetical protein